MQAQEPSIQVVDFCQRQYTIDIYLYVPDITACHFGRTSSLINVEYNISVREKSHLKLS